MTKHIIICCEGGSEQLYIQQLNALLASVESSDETRFVQPLIFHPVLVACGEFTPVMRIIRSERVNNPRTKLQVWVDYDLYHPKRKESKRQKYLSRPKGVPAFHFSFHNFEDFLILHYPPDLLQEWKSMFTDTGHFSQPLHHKEYRNRFSAILPDYKKGSLPSQFVNAVTLGNLKRNLPGRIILPSDEPDFQDFAGFLLDELNIAYPELYRSLP